MKRLYATGADCAVLETWAVLDASAVADALGWGTCAVGAATAGITLTESRQVAVTKLSRERCEERAWEGRAMRNMDVLEVSGTGCARCGVALPTCVEGAERGVCTRYE